MKWKMPKKSTILCGLGIIGVVGTGVATYIATRKSEKILNDDSLTKKEKLLKLAPKFSIPIGIGGATITCIIGNNIYNRKQVKSLAAAYVSLGELFNAYRNEVLKEENGEELDKKYYTTAFSQTALEFKGVDIDEETMQKEITVIEGFSGEAFDITPMDLALALYEANKLYVEYADLSYNQYRELLGLDWKPENDSVGWDMNSGVTWLDYTLEDDERGNYILYIYYPPEPLEHYPYKRVY